MSAIDCGERKIEIESRRRRFWCADRNLLLIVDDCCMRRGKFYNRAMTIVVSVSEIRSGDGNFVVGTSES